MTTATFTKHAEADGSVRLSLAGEIDLANAAEFEIQINAAVDNQATGVTVDLTEVTYIDSAGVRILITLASRLELRGIALRVVGPSGSLARRVIEITGLEDLTTDPP